MKQYIEQQAWYIECTKQPQGSLEHGEGIAREDLMADMSALIKEQVKGQDAKP